MSESNEGVTADTQSNKSAGSVTKPFQKLAEQAVAKYIEPAPEQPEVEPELVEEEDTETSPEPEEEIADEVADDPEEPEEDASELPPGFEPEEDPEEPDQTKERDVVSKKTFEKRLGKATKKIRGLEAENEQLKKQLANRPAGTPLDTSNPVVIATTAAELDTYTQQAEQLADQVKRLQIQVKRNPEKVTEFLEKQGINAEDPELWLEETSLHLNTVLSRTIPARRTFVDQKTVHFQEAVQKYPWLADPNDPKAKWVAEQKAKYPQVEAMVPDIDLVLARSMEGWHGEFKKQVSKQKPTTQPKKPASSGVARKVKTDPLAAGAKQARETGDAKPFFKSIAAQLIQKNGLLKT